MTGPAPRSLRVHLTDYPVTRALREGRVASPGLRFEYSDHRFIFDAFRPMLESQCYDVCEMAIVTVLQAREHGSPLALLPVSVNARFQHGALVFAPDHGPQHPEALAGKRIGVRSYAQTTVTWLRGILERDHGLDPRAAEWVTVEDAHVRAYRDPPWCRRAPEGATLPDMLLSGAVDVAVLPPKQAADPRLRPVFADPQAAAADWFARTGIKPMNHMVVVPQRLCDEAPEVVREVFALLAASKAAAAAESPDMTPIGVEANRTSLAAIIDHALRSRVLSRPVTVDELFDDLTRTLGA
ncbi:hypothetical protein [Salipiger sp.]|uniref:hypothetical protein n=1 Tax=Salipiger sp. TaxID=2078585 RepID=UPI003A97D484